METPTHPLSSLDNSTIEVTYAGQQYDVEVLTSKKSVSNIKNYNDKIHLAALTGYETQKRFMEVLKKQYPDIDGSWFEKNDLMPIEKEDFQKKIKEWIGTTFAPRYGNEDNQTLVFIKDKSGKSLCAMNIWINAKSHCPTNGSPNNVYIDTVQTDSSVKGFMKLIFRAILPDILSRSGINDANIEIATRRIKVTRPAYKEIIKETGEEIEKAAEIIYEGLPVFGAHASTFSYMENEEDKVRVYERWTIDGKEDCIRPEDQGKPLSDFKINESFDETKIKSWVDESKTTLQDQYLAGCFLSLRVRDLEALKNKSCQEKELNVQINPEITRQPSPTPSQRSPHHQTPTISSFQKMRGSPEENLEKLEKQGFNTSRLRDFVERNSKAR